MITDPNMKPGDMVAAQPFSVNISGLLSHFGIHEEYAEALAKSGKIEAISLPRFGRIQGFTVFECESVRRFIYEAQFPPV